jgi:hypothetical protein
MRFQVFGGRLFKRNTNIGLIILGAVLISACGYRFAGQGEFPQGVQHIYIEVFENQDRD